MENYHLPEGFRLIPGHSQYAINEDGTQIRRIQSERYIKAPTVKQQFHPVKGKEYPEGYWYVTLLTRDGVNSRGGFITGLSCVKCTPVHILVARAFVVNNDPKNKVWVNHEDGDKLNNHYTNLVWGTISYNIQHAVNSGLRRTPTGKRHYNYGKTHSDETKRLMSKAKLGENHPKFKGYYAKGCIRYESADQAAAATGLNSRTIKRHAITGKNGWSFEPKQAPGRK